MKNNLKSYSNLRDGQENGLQYVLETIVDVYYDAPERMLAPAHPSALMDAIRRIQECLMYGMRPKFTWIEKESIRDAFRVSRFFEWIET